MKKTCKFYSSLIVMILSHISFNTLAAPLDSDQDQEQLNSDAPYFTDNRGEIKKNEQVVVYLGRNAIATYLGVAPETNGMYSLVLINNIVRIVNNAYIWSPQDSSGFKKGDTVYAGPHAGLEPAIYLGSSGYSIALQVGDEVVTVADSTVAFPVCNMGICPGDTVSYSYFGDNNKVLGTFWDGNFAITVKDKGQTYYTKVRKELVVLTSKAGRQKGTPIQTNSCKTNFVDSSK